MIPLPSSHFGRRASAPAAHAEASPRSSVHATVEAPRPFTERRREARARVLASGKLIFGPGRMTADCLIRNRAPGGMRVKVSSAVELPRELSLLAISDGMLFDAVVIWRRGEEAGLAFTARHDLARDADPRLGEVRALWRHLL